MNENTKTVYPDQKVFQNTKSGNETLVFGFLDLCLGKLFKFPKELVWLCIEYFENLSLTSFWFEMERFGVINGLNDIANILFFKIVELKPFSFAEDLYHLLPSYGLVCRILFIRSEFTFRGTKTKTKNHYDEVFWNFDNNKRLCFPGCGLRVYLIAPFPSFEKSLLQISFTDRLVKKKKYSFAFRQGKQIKKQLAYFAITKQEVLWVRGFAYWVKHYAGNWFWISGDSLAQFWKMIQR